MIPYPVFLYDCKNYFNFLDLQSQYVLKLSHAEFDIHWSKTINDIQRMKKCFVMNNALKPHTKLFPEEVFDSLDIKYKDLFFALKAYWAIKHKDKKHVNLNMPKNEFFNEHVKRKYDHDYLHQMVAYYDQPMFKRCLKDGHDVMLDLVKFEQLSFDDKLKICREEIYVLALERILIPNNFSSCEHQAYRITLKNLVTKMSTKWFPTFIADNYNYLYKFDVNYMKKFLNNIKESEKRTA